MSRCFAPVISKVIHVDTGHKPAQRNAETNEGLHGRKIRGERRALPSQGIEATEPPSDPTRETGPKVTGNSRLESGCGNHPYPDDVPNTTSPQCPKKNAVAVRLANTEIMRWKSRNFRYPSTNPST